MPNKSPEKKIKMLRLRSCIRSCPFRHGLWFASEEWDLASGIGHVSGPWALAGVLLKFSGTCSFQPCNISQHNCWYIHHHYSQSSIRKTSFGHHLGYMKIGLVPRHQCSRLNNPAGQVLASKKAKTCMCPQRLLRFLLIVPFASKGLCVNGPKHFRQSWRFRRSKKISTLWWNAV